MNLNEYTALFLFCLTLSPLMLVLAGNPAGLLIIWGYFGYKCLTAAYRRYREDLWYHSRRTTASRRIRMERLCRRMHHNFGSVFFRSGKI